MFQALLQRSCRLGIALILCLCTSALGAQTLENYLDRLESAVIDGWSPLEPVWPGTDFSNWVLLTTDGDRAWAFDQAGRHSVPANEVLSQGVPNRYLQFGPGEWQGRPAIIVPLGPNPIEQPEFIELESGQPVPFLFNLATHEGFHLYGQTRWAIEPKLELSDRASRYPLGAQPRIVRQHLLLALIGAYLNPEKQTQFLQEAAYWQQRWQQDYPGDAKALAVVDLFEGSARYVEQQAWLAAQGDSLDSVAARQHRIEQLLATAQSPYLSADSESYHLGWVAGLLADRLKLPWREAARAGRSTVLVLLENQTTRVRDPYPQRELALYSLIARYNQYLAQSIEPLLAHWENPEEFVWLVVSGESLRGAYEVGGFFRTQPLAATIHTGYRASHYLDNQGWLQFTGTSLMAPDRPPCGFDSAIVLPLRLEILRLQGDMAYPQAPFLQGQFQVNRSQQGAHTLYCAQ